MEFREETTPCGTLSACEAGRPQLLEEFAFGLLHTLGGFGIADRRGDAL